ncbi:TRAP transporter permease [Natrononativus amylolyticus]|uniref:TRAP transporter permease n=1 Tax=Natrononativus amylolyticus TaxID=2963434 RepID=UPI0020CBC564|nr:TRAP transporter fused permease subunit [Natrononativus amylolyticus]
MIKYDELSKWIVLTLGVLLTTFTIYHAYSQSLVRVRYVNIFLGIALSLFYADEIKTQVTELNQKPKTRSSLYTYAQIGVCALSIAAIIALTSYVEFNFDRLYIDAPVEGNTYMDHIVGALIILIVIDATRRAYGNILAGAVVLSIVYAFVGPWMPGIFRHSGMAWEQVAGSGAIRLSGVYSFIMGVGATWVAIFIMFAGVAKAYGALDHILDISNEVSKKMKSGIVHSALISSMAMGSITGSAAANTATTGSFTIPMMKEQGIRKDYAAAIESVASAGGQILPPIMGVAAFLMADILGVSYVRIIQAGLLPAVVFYLGIGITIHFLILRHNWTSDKSGSIDYGVFLKGIHFLVPLIVLIYTLIVLRYSPLTAGLYTMVTMIVVALLKSVITKERSVSSVKDTASSTIIGFRDGARDMAPLASILAAMGIIVEMVTQTGLSQKISIHMVSLGGEILILVLILAMITSILFGLGMPTPAAYILVVILAAPGVIRMGVPELSAHMFVFYFAMLSAITPPVAISVAIGARIADTNFLKACKSALHIGAAGFLVPYIYVANSSLIYWSLPMTLYSLIAVIIGLVAFSAAIVGYDGHNSIGYVGRVIFLFLSIGALFAPVSLQIIFAVIILTSLAFLHLKATDQFLSVTRG